MGGPPLRPAALPALLPAERRHGRGLGRRDHWSGRFVDLARRAAGLMIEARHAQGAGAALSQAYQLSSCLLVPLGRDDLALIGAERAMAAAASGSDELQWDAAHGTFARVLMNQARNDEAGGSRSASPNASSPA